ncbi:hypothetical protein [Rhodococcus sp. IEGM 1379]|uniref:hypothetical protein n=1 Tax=Rhodococcus sp. IEGM 1379 TaxID=3047086 RepID=UPI0024B6C98C|nr:hypothetical protein [Rhodococcus sp. IEGM 1379]MDI9918260.1 hypothetical protein [Rhodococcus sp. IEGM 1379]
MTVHGSRRRSRGLRLALTTAIVVTVGGSSVVFASPALSAPVPVRTVASAFTAQECEGTEYTPAAQMLEISELRLKHYNDGNIVPLYGSTDRGASLATDAPVCGIREVSGVGAKSEWMYCTDFDLDPCSGVEDGLPVDKEHEVMGPTEPSSGNLTLTENDKLVISWLLQNPATWGNDVSGNSSENARSARQGLVWCISDYNNPLMGEFRGLCDEYLGTAEQARIVTLMKVTQTLDLVRKTPTTGSLKVVDTAVFTLSTNMYGKQIDVRASGGATLTVCDKNSDARLNGNNLTVRGSGSGETAIDLCLTAKTGGGYSVIADVVPDAVENLHWNTAGAQCQVFASFDTVSPRRINVEASVEYSAIPVTTTPAATTPANTPVIVVPIIPIVPVIPIIVPAQQQPSAVAPVTVIQAPTAPAAVAPRQATGPRPTAIDGGSAQQNSSGTSGIALAGFGLIGFAGVGALAIRRTRA